MFNAYAFLEFINAFLRELHLLLAIIAASIAIFEFIKRHKGEMIVIMDSWGSFNPPAKAIG